MITDMYRQFLTGVAFLVLQGCTAHRSSTGGAPPPVADDRIWVRFGFRPSATQRAQLEAAAKATSTAMGSSRLSVSIEQMPEKGERYFFFLIPPPEFQRGTVHFAIGVARESTVDMSPAFDTEIPFGPTGIYVERLADFDNDGASDILYCVKTKATSPGEARIAGFKAGRWYRIADVPSPDMASCSRSIATQ